MKGKHAHRGAGSITFIVEQLIIQWILEARKVLQHKAAALIAPEHPMLHQMGGYRSSCADSLSAWTHIYPAEASC